MEQSLKFLGGLCFRFQIRLGSEGFDPQQHKWGRLEFKPSPPNAKVSKAVALLFHRIIVSQSSFAQSSRFCSVSLCG